MLKRLLLVLAALLVFPVHFPVQALAQVSTDDLSGSWALRIDDANIFVFDIMQDGDDDWSGTWTRPESLRSNGVVFAQMSGSQELASAGGSATAGIVELRFEDPQPGARAAIFRFRLVSENRAELDYFGTDTAPYPLVRVAPGTPLGPFDATRIYDRDNAVTEAEYVAPPVEEETAALPDEPVEDEAVAEAIEEAAPPSNTERGRLTDDFLDDLADNLSAVAAPVAEPDAQIPTEAPAAQIVRACSDFSRRNGPTPQTLESRWGGDFESIGSGLDIREYRMDNGDIARVTMLGDTVFINSCGPAD